MPPRHDMDAFSATMMPMPRRRGPDGQCATVLINGGETDVNYDAVMPISIVMLILVLVPTPMPMSMSIPMLVPMVLPMMRCRGAVMRILILLIP